MLRPTKFEPHCVSPREDIKLWSSLTESEVPYSQYKGYLASSFWGISEAQLQTSTVFA